MERPLLVVYIRLLTMKGKVEENASYFERLPDIEVVIDSLYQVWNSRIVDTIDFATGLALKECFVEKYVNELSQPEKLYVTTNEKTFIEWINDRTMIMVIRVMASERDDEKDRVAVTPGETNNKMKLNESSGGIINMGKRSIDKIDVDDRSRARTRTQDVCMESSIHTMSTEMIATTESSRKKAVRNEKKEPPVTTTTAAAEAAILACDTVDNPTTVEQVAVAFVDKELRDNNDVTRSTEPKYITTENNLTDGIATVLESSACSKEMETENLPDDNEEYIDTTSGQVTFIPMWRKDSSQKLDRFGHKRVHVDWYRKMIGRQKEEFENMVGYCTVKYPDIFDEEIYKRTVTDQRIVVLPNNTCCSCLKFFVARERIVKVHQHKKEITACNHIYCERCAYIWFVSLPEKTEYLGKNILVATRHKCGACNTTGIIRKAVYKEDDETFSSHPDWVEGETFPMKQKVFGTHQVTDRKFLHYITNRNLFIGIKKMQLEEANNNSTADELTYLERKKYEEYHRAVYSEFNCTGCSETKKNIEIFHGENCVSGCFTTLCLECSSDVVVRTFGSRKGSSNLKYIRGVFECKGCKGKLGRLVNLFTKQFFSKYANCTNRTTICSEDSR
jgi:hypothetical protein